MFKIEEIVKATKGKLLTGSPSLEVKDISTDSRSIGRGELFIALKGKNFDGHNFLNKAAGKKAAAFLIESQFLEKDPRFISRLGQKIACVCVKDSLRGLGDLASFWRKKFSLPVIAVTGSSGKTTTKEMISWVLGAKYRVLMTAGTENNFVGVPLNLFRLRSDHQIACIELGTSAFGEIERLSEIVSPNLGVITNIGEAHLEGLKSKAGVFKEKSRLLDNLIKPAIALLNYDDDYLKRFKNSPKNVFGFSLNNRSDFMVPKFHFDKLGLKFSLGRSKQKFAIRTFGAHNIYNSLAAIAVGLIFGIGEKTIARRLGNFEFPPSRFNFIRKKGLTIIDDTYNANPMSLRSALTSLAAMKHKGRRILVIADMLELGADSARLHKQIGAEISRKDFDFIISMGHLAGNVIAGALENGFDSNKALRTLDYDQTIGELRSLVKSGDCLLIKGSHAMRMGRVVNFLSKLKKI